MKATNFLSKLRWIAFACAVVSPGCVSYAAPTQSSVTRDSHENLHGALWVQTSAEFESLCRVTYQAAGSALSHALKDKKWTAALEQTGSFKKLKPAVVLDLDETVLDNLPFQGALAKARRPYDPTVWTDWVKLAQASAIPGAVEFLRQAKAANVEIFYVSNREFALEAYTVKNLLALGLPADAEHVWSQNENGWTSEKSARRSELAKTYRILLLVGDDLGDFVAGARVAPDDRKALSRAHADMWGTRWFLLPNPQYGSWERGTYPAGSNDTDTLKAKFQMLKGF